MKNRDGLENSNDWQTPGWLYNELDSIYHFDFDPCPYQANFNGLVVPWGKSNFINPPYDRVNKPLFIEKSISESEQNRCVLLIPASMGTKHTHMLLDLVPRHNRVTLEEWKGISIAERRADSWMIFPKGRIAFKGYNTNGVWSENQKGKHDSMIVVLNSKT